MILARAPRILLCADQAGQVTDIPRLFEEGGPTVDWHDWGAGEPSELAAYHMIVIDGSRSTEDGLQFCRRLHAALGERFVPTLFLAGGPDVTVRLASLEVGADACLARPFTPAEFLAHV